MFKTYYVYILLCSDNKYYVGITNNLDRRLYEHQTGYNKKSFTYSRRPVELVYYAMFNNIGYAIDFEKQIKRWSRKRKEALIKDNWDEIIKLAKKKFKKSKI